MSDPKPIKLALAPGFFSEAGDADATARWKTGDRVRFKDGLPEKMGGWERSEVFNDNVAFPSDFIGDVLLAQVTDGTLNEYTGVPSIAQAGSGGLSTVQALPLFGTTSYRIQGTATTRTNYVLCSSSGPRFIFPGDFTIEGYFYLNSYKTSFNGLIASDIAYAGTGSWGLNVQSTGGLWFISDLITLSPNTFPFTLGAWHHVAVTRQAGTLRMFYDGALQKIGNNAAQVGALSGSNTAVRIGAAQTGGDNGDLDGYFAGVRITKGFARYTADFTPTFAPFSTVGAGPPSAQIAVTGIDRRLHEWASLDGQAWIAQGTSKKLYVINRNTRYDITPVARSVSLTNAFTTTNGSAVVTVVDPLHGAETGGAVRFGVSSPVGGITLAGEYTITVLDGNRYTITHSSAATSGATGGGTVVAEYDLSIGPDSSEQAHGWGTCLWNQSTWGTRRGNCSNITIDARLWSLDNFGEDLLASPRGGGLYWWDRSQGPATRAVQIAPDIPTIERMLVSPAGNQVILLGAFDNISSTPDKMLIRTSDIDSLTVFEQPLDVDQENNVFDYRLSTGSRILTGEKTNGGVIVNTDKMAYIMRPDAQDIYTVDPIGRENQPAGPNAIFDVNGTAFWMGEQNFVLFDGVQQTIPCDVWGYVFDNEALTPGFNRAQKVKVYGYFNARGDECTWFYPSRDAIENDRYVCYNRGQKIWYYGALSRTTMNTGGIAYSVPYGTSGQTGALYLHETGTDDNGAAMNEYIETWDMAIGVGEMATHLSLYVPNYKRITGTMRMTVSTKDTPQQAAVSNSYVYDMPQATTEQGMHDSGRYMIVRFGTTLTGTDWRMAQGMFYGRPDASR